MVEKNLLFAIIFGFLKRLEEVLEMKQPGKKSINNPRETLLYKC